MTNLVNRFFFRIIFVDAGSDGYGWGIGEWGIEQVPGFFVGFEAHLLGFAVGVEAEHGLGGADFDGDDVPDVEGDDPSAALRAGC